SDSSMSTENIFKNEIVTSELNSNSQYTIWLSAVYINNHISSPSTPKLVETPSDVPSVSVDKIVIYTGLAVLILVVMIIGSIFIKRKLCKLYADLNTKPRLPPGINNPNDVSQQALQNVSNDYELAKK
ncbi:unnamed protein product, partial [Meganyctiphanes norvegica]